MFQSAYPRRQWLNPARPETAPWSWCISPSCAAILVSDARVSWTPVETSLSGTKTSALQRMMMLKSVSSCNFFWWRQHATQLSGFSSYTCMDAQKKPRFGCACKWASKGWNTKPLLCVTTHHHRLFDSNSEKKLKVLLSSKQYQSIRMRLTCTWRIERVLKIPLIKSNDWSKLASRSLDSRWDFQNGQLRLSKYLHFSNRKSLPPGAHYHTVSAAARQDIVTDTSSHTAAVRREALLRRAWAAWVQIWVTYSTCSRIQTAMLEAVSRQTETVVGRNEWALAWS